MLLRRHLAAAAALIALSLSTAFAQQPAATPPAATVLRAARLLDPKSGVVTNNVTVVVERGRITAVGANVTAPANARVIELGNVTLLPGLIDAHTHLLQNYLGQYGGDDPNMLLTVATMSPAARALLGVKMGREDLEAG